MGGEILLDGKARTALLALGFGASPEEAAENALASLAAGYDKAAKTYETNWQPWQSG